MPEPGSALAVLAQVTFADGTKQPYDVPRSTLDPRHTLCADHHPACDCREAELHEVLREYRQEAHEADRLQKLSKAIAVLHGPKLRKWTAGADCQQCWTGWPCPTITLAAGMDPYVARQVARFARGEEDLDVIW